MLAPCAPTARPHLRRDPGRVQETDESAPVPDGPWEYTTRTVEGSQYAHPLPAAARRGSADAARPARRERARGRRRLLLARRLRDHPRPSRPRVLDRLHTAASVTRCASAISTTGTDLADVVDDVTYGLAWADDARTCFYVRPDDAMRPYEVWRHTLGTARERRRARATARTTNGSSSASSARAAAASSCIDVVVEADLRGVVRADRRARRRAPRVVAPREHGHEYSVEHHWSEERGDRFLIVTNQGGEARNFELVAAPCVDPARQYWTPLVPHRDDVKLDAVDAFADHLVLSERANGLDRICGDARRRRRRPRDRVPRSRVHRVGRPQRRVRHDTRCATATRRSSRPPPTSTTT